MVSIKRIGGKNGKVYLAVYKGSKFIRYLGREDKYTPEKLNYIRRSLDGKNK
jgi:hypothetical protein